jgi:hypothetical protein
MKTFIVLGSHGGGTSLVSAILQTLGVNMHYNPKGKVKDYCTFEDSDFLRLNHRILKAAGGSWNKPPVQVRIDARAEKFAPQIKKLVKQKQSKLWGWKDPRNALTIGLYHPHLVNPHYVYIVRNADDAANSIATRGPGGQDRFYWAKLTRDYYKRVALFLKGVDSPRLELNFDRLIKDNKREVQRIAQFVGVKLNMQKVLGVFK